LNKYLKFGTHTTLLSIYGAQLQSAIGILSCGGSCLRGAVCSDGSCISRDHII